MEWLIGFSAVIGTWTFLSVLGSERERRNRDLETQIAHHAAVAARATADAAAAEARANR